MDSLSSFSFQLSYRSAPPATLAASYSGVHVAPDIESWNGFWQRGTERSQVRLVGSGVTQYEDFGSGWQRSERGVETQVLAQARAVFASDTLVLAGRRGDRLAYQFKPRVPMLDPAQVQRFIGEMELDEQRLLPLRVVCRDSADAAEWVLTLGRFNRAPNPQLPFVPSSTVRAVPVRRVGGCVLRRAARVLDQRLAVAGLDHRMGVSWGTVNLQLAAVLSPSVVGLLLSRGAVEVWTAEWHVASVPSDSPRHVVTVGGDAARLASLGELVCRNGSMSAQPDLSLPMSPTLVLTPTRSPVVQSRLYVLVVDGRAVASSSALEGEVIRFSDLGDNEMVIALSAVAARAEMPVGLTAVR